MTLQDVFLLLTADLLPGATGFVLYVLAVRKQRQKQCGICRKYYGDDTLLAEQFQRCPECGSAREYQANTAADNPADNPAYPYHQPSPVQREGRPLPNISAAAYLQYRTACRESHRILAVFLLICCFIPLLTDLTAYCLTDSTIPGPWSWFFRYGFMLSLMLSGIVCRPMLEERLALYYGLITRCVHCHKSFYPKAGAFSKSSRISRILFTGRCPCCGGKVVR